MSSSRARNFRRRADDDEDNNDDNTPSVATTTATKKPPSSSKPKKLLSFADDEEEKSEIPTSNRDRTRPSSRLSKPSSSHKITASKERQSSSATSSSTSLLSNVQAQAGTYTEEYLLELRKNTKTLKAPSSKPPAEPVVVLRGSIKPEDSNLTRVQQKPSRDSSDSDSDRSV